MQFTSSLMKIVVGSVKRKSDICDASRKVHLHVYTKFSSMGGDAASVHKELKEVLQSLEVCSNCLVSGNAKDCKFPSLHEACTRCARLELKDAPCVSA